MLIVGWCHWLFREALESNLLLNAHRDAQGVSDNHKGTAAESLKAKTKTCQNHKGDAF